MAQAKNPMEIFQVLEKSNCRECNEATCLAFAAAVFQGRKPITDCPRLDPETAARFGETGARQKTVDAEMDEAVARLKQEVAGIDLAAAAERVGGRFSRDRLTVKVLGKDFTVDAQGNLYSDIHIHGWLAIPFLQYVLEGGGAPISGKWVPLRELEGGKDWYRLFGQRCEKPIKQVADTYTELFEDMVHLFNGKPVENHYQSDISMVLHPLPLLPVLICYWKPDDGFESSLNLFFDATAEENLKIGAIYALATGLVRMFEKLALRHGI